jgi:hypothetical protein
LTGKRASSATSGSNRRHRLANVIGDGRADALRHDCTDQLTNGGVVGEGRHDPPTLITGAACLVEDRVREHE